MKINFDEYYIPCCKIVAVNSFGLHINASNKAPLFSSISCYTGP